MKKNYYSLFAAATMLLAASSCSQEEAIPQPSSELVSFEISLEGVAESRIAGDGLTANKLYYEVYQGTDDGRTKVLDNYGDGKTEGHEVITLDGGKTEVKLPLLRGEKYEIMFWAQADNSIYNPNDLEKISVTYDDKTTANNEAYDAFFYGDDEFKATNDVTKIELRRPFAQLNIGTHEDDWAQALEVIGGTDAPVTQSTVTVTNLATSFNVLSGVATAPEEPNTVTFQLANINGETFEAKDDNYNNLAMNYLLVPGTPDEEGNVKSTTNVTATFYRGITNLFTIGELPTVAIQRNWRTNILGNLLADDKTFTIEVVPGFLNDHNIDYSTVDSDEDLEAALRQTDDEIVIDLAEGGRAGKTYTVNIGAWTEEYYFGGANTKTITINANGNTICFNHNNTDWNYIRCVNENAKWIINNAHLTNSGKNDGPWNRHDIRFYNAVELNDVTSDKAIALLNNGKLENVSITEDIEAYGLWITAQGQTVDINNLEITATNAGRGICIKDEYVDEPKAVTLNVANSKFTTAKKAAILVTSTAGATIKLENIDLSGVKADGFNAVWVDKDRANYADLVTVTGGFKKIEEDTETTSPFEVEGATVEIPAGTYAFPAKVAKGVTINCAKGVVFAGKSGLDINGATVNGATFSNPEGNAVGGTINGTFKNCNFEGSNAFRYCYAGETVVFENCVFDGAVYGVHFDGGANDVMFKNCTLSGFNAFGSALTQLTFEGCTFKSTGKSGYNGANLWGATKLINTTFEFDGSASTEWIGLNAANSNKDIVFENCKVSGDKELLDYFANYNSGNKVTVDGKIYSLVEDNDALKAAIEDKTVSLISLEEGTTFEGTFAIAREVVIRSNANNKATIKGRVNISGDASFSNIKFDINDDSKVKNSFTGAQYNYPGIVVIYTAATTFEGCEFKSDMASGVCGINYGAHAAGKLLTVNNCSFEGDFYAIRSRTQFSVTNSKFNIFTTEGKLCAVWTWGNGNTWADSVTFTGNENLNENEIYGVQLTSKNFKYNNMDINVQGNTGFAKLEDSINPACTFSDIRFAEGSETFSF